MRPAGEQETSTRDGADTRKELHGAERHRRTGTPAQKDGRRVDEVKGRRGAEDGTRGDGKRRGAQRSTRGDRESMSLF